MGIRKKGSIRIPKPGREKWKPLQLNEAILSGGIEGLVGIEELVDYKPTIVQKGVDKNNVKDTTEKAENVKKHKKAQPELGAENKFIIKTNTLKRKKEKNRIKFQKLALHKTKLDKNTKQDVHMSHVINNSRSESYTHVSEENNSQNKFNKFLQSEQLEAPLPLALKAVRKKRKHAISKNSQPEKNALELVEPNKKKSICTSPKTTKRSRSPEILQNETVSKRVKQHSKKSKIKKNQSNVCVHIQSAKELVTKNFKTKKQAKTVRKAKKKNSCNNLHTSTKSTDDTICTSSGPVTGMEGWDGLNLPESILGALADKGFTSPTEIQSLSLPAAVLGRRDIMGAAETGSGKTLAFGIPIIYGILQQKKKEAYSGDLENVAAEAEPLKMDEENEVNYGSDNENEHEIEDIDHSSVGIGCVKVIDNVDISKISYQTENANKPTRKGRLYALVLTPTRELAVQVRDHIKAAAKYTGIKVAVVIGGLAPQKQERLLRAAPEIVVATPGRLWEMIQEGNVHLQQVDNISFLAIDETDRMVEQGHFQELHELLERINRSEENKTRRQNFVFSATLTLVHEPPQRKKSKQKKKKMRVTPGQKLQEVITMVGMTNPKVVDITRDSGTCGNLEEAQISCTFEEKDIYLYYFLIKHPGRTLIFCNSISCVRRLAQLLTILMCKPFPIHANMIQRQRLRNLDKFRDSPTGLLLATDVAARGLDIPDVQHVIHYQVPRTSEGYIHRSGRTARASKKGLTLLLVEPNEQQTFARLCRTLGRDQQLPIFPVSQDLFNAAKQRMYLAREIDQLELTSRRADSEKGWFQKAMSDMDMLLDDDDIPKRISKEDSIGNRQVASKKRKQLEMLLSRPLFSSRM